MSINPYTPEEIEAINKLKESNTALEDFFKTERDKWADLLKPVFDSLRIDKNNLELSNSNIRDRQADALYYSQIISDEITKYLNSRSRFSASAKKLRQDKFIFYATGFPLKTQMGEKSMLIDGNLSEMDRKLEIIEAHIEFLRETTRTIKNFLYGVKNIIELLNYFK